MNFLNPGSWGHLIPTFQIVLSSFAALPGTTLHVFSHWISEMESGDPRKCKKQEREIPTSSSGWSCRVPYGRIPKGTCLIWCHWCFLQLIHIQFKTFRICQNSSCCFRPSQKQQENQEIRFPGCFIMEFHAGIQMNAIILHQWILLLSRWQIISLWRSSWHPEEKNLRLWWSLLLVHGLFAVGLNSFVFHVVTIFCYFILIKSLVFGV